jgi:DNA repair exonuclease SbcCD ATPase subunit
MKTANEKLENFLSGLRTEIDILACVDLDNVTDYNSLYDEIENSRGFDIDIIYYSSAMEYLSNNDPSLNESMALASDMGFTPENLNSETLASLLASQNVREEFAELESEISIFFEELEEYRTKIEELEEKEEELESLQTEYGVGCTDEDLKIKIEALESEIKELENEIENLV